MRRDKVRSQTLPPAGQEQEWTDDLEFEITPVNNDEDVMKVLGG